eukprot:TRINITY_DN62016_c0_g1_i1.p1 TRINITY_DN62016_c0_g1~~TRINITY_DN62016_c0_g1_i1.p1  ORF type:complete len:794 (-),score=82.07 TRINITY_DN62016_c0_g1_i1:146-2383(-)
MSDCVPTLPTDCMGGSQRSEWDSIPEDHVYKWSATRSSELRMDVSSTTTKRYFKVFLHIHASRIFKWSRIAFASANVLFTYLEANHRARVARGKSDVASAQHYTTVDTIFILHFMFELIIRCAVVESIFMHKRLLFDLLVVFAWVIDSWVLRLAHCSPASVVGILSAFVSRTLRFSRLEVVTGAASLRSGSARWVIKGMRMSVEPAICAMGGICTFAFFSALLILKIAQATMDWPLPPELDEFWGGVGRGVLTVMEMMLSARAWSTETVEPFDKVDKSTAVFCVTMAVVIAIYFGILSLIAATFMELVYRIISDDSRMIEMLCIFRQEDCMNELVARFSALSENGADCLSLEEFENGCAANLALMRQTGASLLTVRTVFEHLDKKSKGVVPIVDFVREFLAYSLSFAKLDNIVCDYQQHECTRNFFRLDTSIAYESLRMRLRVQDFKDTVRSICDRCAAASLASLEMHRPTAIMHVDMASHTLESFVPGKVQVHIIGARNLSRLGGISANLDTYLTCHITGQELTSLAGRSHVVKDSENPLYEMNYTFESVRPNDTLEFKVYQTTRGGTTSTCVGTARLQAHELLPDGFAGLLRLGSATSRGKPLSQARDHRQKAVLRIVIEAPEGGDWDALREDYSKQCDGGDDPLEGLDDGPTEPMCTPVLSARADNSDGVDVSPHEVPAVSQKLVPMMHEWFSLLQSEGSSAIRNELTVVAAALERADAAGGVAIDAFARRQQAPALQEFGA